jgi:phosphoribosylformylglycinamidine cyclo-ligase
LRAVAGLTYRDAGVDIDAGDELVTRISPHVRATHTADVLGGFGGFSGLCRVPPGMREPVLVSGTDGVGTKLKLAFALGRHDTIGIDLVAMCVNDILTAGARPLFFLDYFATSRLDVTTAASVVEGIAAGCRQAGCALLGGETAEMPGMYTRGEYDVAGFAVGVAERDALLPRTDVAAGDVVIGVASDGVHSNGFSLVRRVIEDAKLALDKPAAGLDEPLGDVLLRPTRIYCKPVLATLEQHPIKAMCHVTGGGIVGNLPRVLPDGLGAVIEQAAWSRPPIFELIAREGGVAEDEMRRAFNLGLGLLVVTASDVANDVVATLQAQGEQAQVVGRIEACETPEARVRFS